MFFINFLVGLIMGLLVAEGIFSHFNKRKFTAIVAALISTTVIALVVSLCLTLLSTLIYREAHAGESPLVTLRQTTLHIAIGSGSIVEAPSGEKYLLTNWHVCNSGAWLGKMRANYEGGELVEGKVVKSEPLVDLCATRVSKDHKALKIGKSLSVRDQIYTRGYPYGVLSETSGQYLGKEKWTFVFPIEEVGNCFLGSYAIQDGQGRVEGCQVLYKDNMTNMYSRPGSSGSPVVNEKGELIGVMSSWVGSKDEGGMVPLEYIQEFFKDL